MTRVGTRSTESSAARPSIRRPSPSTRFVALIVLLATACGGATPAPAPPPRTGVGTSPAPDEVEAEVVAEGAVELGLRRADGTFIDVGELRGEVVLLYLFATFDAVSQMILNPLRNVAERHPDVRIVGVAAQPSARLLVDAYEHALSPPFPVGYDPSDVLIEGRTALGVIDVIPVLVALDRRGVEVARHTGLADEARIEEMLRAAGAR